MKKRSATDPTNATSKPRRSVWQLLRLWTVAVILVCGLGVAPTVKAQNPAGQQESRETRRILAAVVAAVVTNPEKAEEIMTKAMREHPRIAAKIAKAVIAALPKKAGVPDSYILARLVKTALELIYSEFPDAREEVQAIVLTGIEALRDANGVIDPKAVAIILSSALPIIAANDSASIDPLIKALLAMVPEAEGIVNQLLADLRSPLGGTNSRLGRRSMQVEPNFVASE